MKKTILSLAVAEIIIGYGMQSHAHAATINNVNEANKNTTTISALQKSGKIISIGSQGDVVRSIQRLLNSIEGFNIQEDGLFGSETYNAIIRYQTKNNLKKDGIVGKETATKLLSISANFKANTTNSKIVTEAKTDNVKTANEIIQSELNSKKINSDTNYFIVVSKSQREVYIYYKELESWVNIKVFPCNIGASETPTIEGNFQSGLKGKELRMNETFIKYFTQISGNYLFHSVPYNELGELMDTRLGETISHGCVRLSLEDAKYIYDVIPARTGIKIIK